MYCQYIFLVLTCTTAAFTLSRVKKDASYLPDFSAFPNLDSGSGGGGRVPQPSTNPFLDTMYTPYNLDYGLGVSVLYKPFITGGNINYPTGNRMKPTDSVAGTFSYAAPWNLRYGTQGGPFFPWQSKEFFKTAESISEVNARQQQGAGGFPLTSPENARTFSRGNAFTSSDDRLPPMPPGS